MIRKKFDNMLMTYSFFINENNKNYEIEHNISKLICNEEFLWEEDYINNRKLCLIYKTEDYFCDTFRDLTLYIKKCELCQEWKYKEDIKYHLKKNICNICINVKKKCYMCLDFNKLINFKDSFKCDSCIDFENKLCNLCKNNKIFNEKITCKKCWNDKIFLICKICNISKLYDVFHEFYKCKLCWYKEEIQCIVCNLPKERRHIINNICIECKDKRSIICNCCKNKLDPELFLFINNKYNERCNICVKDFFENIPETF